MRGKRDLNHADFGELARTPLLVPLEKGRPQRHVASSAVQRQVRRRRRDQGDLELRAPDQVDRCFEQRVPGGGKPTQHTVVSIVEGASIEAYSDDFRNTQPGLFHQEQQHQLAQRRGIAALHHVCRRVRGLSVLQVKSPLDEIHAVGPHHKLPLTLRRCFKHMPRIVCRKFPLCVVRAIVLKVHFLDIFQAHVAQFTLDAAHELVVGAQVGTETLAAAGQSLVQVTAEARAAAEGVASMGVALTTCTLPGAAVNTRLEGDVVEIGLGIHGEPGAEQCKWRPCGTKKKILKSQSSIVAIYSKHTRVLNFENLDELVDEALKSILDPIKCGDNKPYLTPAPGSQLAVLINSLGATPPMELAVIGRRVVERPLFSKVLYTVSFTL